jgi:hypothetical protein
MTDNHRIIRGRDARVNRFAAELTSAVYPLVLRRGLQDSWLQVELSLWKVLSETVEKWARQRPPAASRDERRAWREGFLVDLTENAFFVALKNGIQGPLLEVELALYRAFRLVFRRRSRGR